MRDPMAILGDAVVKDITGFDWGGVVKGVVNMASTGVEQYQSDEAKKQAGRDATSALSRSVGADQEWANAAANLWLAQQNGDATTINAAQIVRDSKKHDADAAASVLSGDGPSRRCSVAQDALKSAGSAAAAAPKDIAKQAKLHAWQEVASACGGGGGGSLALSDSGAPRHGRGGGGDGGGSWLTVKRGGLPTYGWIGVGVGGVALLALLVRMMRKK